jgi:adenylate cyclase
VIFAHGGTVNEYVGNSVLAIFGAPIAHEDHAALAVKAGIQLLHKLHSTDTRHPEKLTSRAREARPRLPDRSA